MEEIEQMNNLFQQKQRELVMAATKVEELNRQLELLKTSKMENFNDNQSSVAELDRLYKELQVCKKGDLLNRNSAPEHIASDMFSFQCWIRSDLHLSTVSILDVS